MSEPENNARRRLIDYRMIWRWHFYAGLFCIPIIVLLCLTGPIYLFKPQVEAWIDRPYDHLAFAGEARPADEAVRAALAAVPHSRFAAMEVRNDAHDAVRIDVVRDGEQTRVYVHPQSLRVLKIVPEDSRFMNVVKTLHGELLSGRAGQVVVELAASWAIVMILTGLYLWWPRDTKGAAGVLWPRFGMGSRIMWRDLHAVTGVYVSLLALFLLLTGLPWTYVWGNGFKMARSLGHPVSQDWSLGRHDEHMKMRMDMSADVDLSRLDERVARSRDLHLAPPAILKPSHNGMSWTLTSDNGNRTLRETAQIDATTLEVTRRETFGDKPLLDRVVGVGISAHEGQLFGPVNQALGVLTAAGLLTLCVSSIVMWWSRRPKSTLGAPLQMPDEHLAPGLAVVIVALALFLPVLGVSLLAAALIERLILRRIPGVRAWLGII